MVDSHDARWVEEAELVELLEEEGLIGSEDQGLQDIVEELEAERVRSETATLRASRFFINYDGMSGDEIRAELHLSPSRIKTTSKKVIAGEIIKDYPELVRVFYLLQQRYCSLPLPWSIESCSKNHLSFWANEGVGNQPIVTLSIKLEDGVLMTAKDPRDKIVDEIPINAQNLTKTAGEILTYLKNNSSKLIPEDSPYVVAAERNYKNLQSGGIAVYSYKVIRT